MDVDDVDVTPVHREAERGVHRVDVVDDRGPVAFRAVLVDGKEIALLLDEGNLFHVGAADALARNARRRGKHADR